MDKVERRTKNKKHVPVCLGSIPPSLPLAHFMGTPHATIPIRQAAEASMAAEGGEAERKAMVVGIDDSEHSFYALQWTLGHFFSGGGGALGYGYKLVVVNAKPSPASIIGLGGPGTAEVLPYVESDLRKIAARVIDKARELCVANSVIDAVYEVVEGDARNILCDTVEKFHADMLVVGSHGYGALKRAVLGSVSDYCAHHAHCSVMIVKKPKHQH